VGYPPENKTGGGDQKLEPFRRVRMMEVPPGGKKSGSLLSEAAEESERTKEPIGRIMKRLLPEATIETVLDRGDGVPDMVKRSGKK